MKNELKNGTELLLSLVLSMDLLEQYKSNHNLKNKINLAKNAIEKSVTKHYERLYIKDEEFVQNSLNLKERLVKTIAKYNEADIILLSEYVNTFDKNIEICRNKGSVFFNKILK